MKQIFCFFFLRCQKIHDEGLTLHYSIRGVKSTYFQSFILKLKLVSAQTIDAFCRFHCEICTMVIYN